MEIGTKTMTFQWKHRIITIILTGFLYVGILMMFDYLSNEKTNSLNSLIFQGVFFGVFMGLGFPYLTEKFATRFTSKIGKSIKPELTQDEIVQIEGPANLFRGIEAVGGKLFLTNKKIVFKSHKINIQEGQTEIHYENINDIVKIKTAKLINNGIRIKINDGKEFDFVVNERERWIEELNKRITHYQNV